MSSIPQSPNSATRTSLRVVWPEAGVDPVKALKDYGCNQIGGAVKIVCIDTVDGKPSYSFFDLGARTIADAQRAGAVALIGRNPEGAVMLISLDGKQNLDSRNLEEENFKGAKGITIGAKPRERFIELTADGGLIKPDGTRTRQEPFEKRPKVDERTVAFQATRREGEQICADPQKAA